jgi:hypothetical protein
MQEGVQVTRAFRAFLVLAVFPLVVAAGESGPPAGWQEVGGGFKKKAYLVWLPKDGKLTEKESSIIVRQHGQVRVFRTVLERNDGSLLAAGQIILPPGLTNAPLKVRQDFFRDMALEEFNGKLVEEKKTKLGIFTGKEYLIKTPKGMARYRVLGTGVQVFRLIFVGTKEQLESKDAAIFFDSFKRTPQTKPSTDKNAK